MALAGGNIAPAAHSNIDNMPKGMGGGEDLLLTVSSSVVKS